MKADLVAIGKIARLHGIRGELKVVSFSQPREVWAHFSRLWLIQGEQVESFPVERVRQGGRFLIVKLRNVDHPEVAERFRGWEVAVPSDRLPLLPAGQFYSYQLVGLAVVTESGEVVGRIEEIWPMVAHDIYCIRGKRGQVLIPAVKEIVRDVDLEKGRVVIRAPEGLLELEEGVR